MEESFLGWRRYALVQPPLMILIFAQAMSGNILTDLIVYRTCTITLGINNTECLLLHQNSSCSEALKLDAKVQPHASFIIMSKSFIESILPTFLSLFLGPWSDRYGRKPLMLSGYIGLSLTYFTFSMMVVWDISPWFLLLASIPSACFGGLCIIVLGSICYITDISNEEERAWQLAWLDTLISFGVIIGLFTGPIVFRQYGYTVVFGSATICSISAGLYIYFLVPESIQNRNSMRTLDTLFDVSLVKDLVSTCTKKRAGFNRCIVWSCISCLTLNSIVFQGQMTIGFLFTSARLGWDVNQFSVYMATNVIVCIIGTVIGIKFFKAYGGLSEETTAILSVLSSIGGALTKSFTWQPWQMYLSIVIEALNGVGGPTIRALLSKSIPAQDTGKVFSLTVSIETLTPFAAASLYSLVYSYFMPPIYPLPVWLVSAGVYVIVVGLLLNIRLENRRFNTNGYIPLPQDDVAE